MLAKYYKQQGMNAIEIREAIFAWGGKWGIYITYNLNNIIRKAVEDKIRLRDNVIVRVSKSDIFEVVRRFDSRNARLLALALLCYAKATANGDGEFSISSVALGCWIGIDNANIISRYLPELIDFGYIKKLGSKPVYSWDKSAKYKQLNLKILMPINNEGDYTMNDNDIHQLFIDCFPQS